MFGVMRYFAVALTATVVSGLRMDSKESASQSGLAKGDRVITKGFADEAMNGNFGTVAKYISSKGKYKVTFDKPINERTT